MKLSQDQTDRIVAALLRIGGGEVGNTEAWRDAEWRAFDRTVMPLEDRFTRKAFRAFVALGDVAVRTLRSTAEGETAHEDMIVGAVQATSLGLFKKIGEEEIPVLLANGWRYGTRQIEAAIASRRRSAGGFSLKLANPFDVNWPEVGMYILFRPRRYSGSVTETTITGFRKILTRLFNEGAGIEPMAREITNHFSEIAMPRARTIARTECLIGDTLVDGAVVRAIYRRWYDGPVVEIRTCSGRKFSATPNHPMLSRRGWIHASALSNDDDLICYTGQQNASSAGHEHIAARPTTLSEIFNSLSTISFRERERTRQPDFHGDGMDGDVEIFRPDWPLSFGHFATLDEPAIYHLLAPADPEVWTMFCKFCRSLLSINELTGGGDITNGYPGSTQSTYDGFPRESEGRSYLLRRVPVLVVGDDHVNRKIINIIGGYPSSVKELTAGLRPRSTPYSISMQRTMNLIHRCSDLSGHQGSAQSRDIEIDRVESVVFRKWRGYVYNLSTPAGYFTISGGLYTGNTISASNMGAFNSYRASNVVTGRIWISSKDQRVRDTHRIADGQEQDMDAPFRVGGYRLMYPGDTSLGAAISEWISCRCALAPRVKALPGLA